MLGLNSPPTFLNSLKWSTMNQSTPNFWLLNLFWIPKQTTNFVPLNIDYMAFMFRFAFPIATLRLIEHGKCTFANRIKYSEHATSLLASNKDISLHLQSIRLMGWLFCRASVLKQITKPLLQPHTIFGWNGAATEKNGVENEW